MLLYKKGAANGLENMLAWAVVAADAVPESLDIEGANTGIGMGIIGRPWLFERETVLEVVPCANTPRSLSRAERHAKLAQASLRRVRFIAGSLPLEQAQTTFPLAPGLSSG
jgi:hypothetical protein